MNKVTVRLCELDKPTKNGTIYPRNLMEQILSKYSDTTLPGGKFNYDDIDVSRCSHTASNLRIEGNYIVADITILETRQGKILVDLLDEDLELDFHLNGNGLKDKNGALIEYTPLYVSVGVKL